MNLMASIDLAFAERRQERGVENVGRVRSGLEGMDEGELVERLGEACGLDRSQPVSPHFRGEDVLSDGHAQPLDLRFPSRCIVALENRIDRLRWAPDRLF